MSHSQNVPSQNAPSQNIPESKSPILVELVCLSVCKQHNLNSYGRVAMTFYEGVKGGQIN